MNRDDLITIFLVRNGYAPSDAEPLAGDASIRRYLRIRGTPPAILMDAPPPEDVRPFLRIATYLGGLGLAVPAILAADEANGLILEQDLGDDLLGVLLDRGEAPDELLDAAVDTLVAMQRAALTPESATMPMSPEMSTSPKMPALPRWDAAAMAAATMGTLFDWWWPAAFGAAAPAAARADIGQALTAMLTPIGDGPSCFVHRDYFAGNLLRLADHRVGIIDFQGAAIGHPAYDLVSLLQDARRDISARSRQRGLARYLTARSDLDRAEFSAAFAACAAQRHLRVACQWVRLAMRDDRPQYLAYGPRTWRLLADALVAPAAAPLAAALDRWIPLARRGNPDLATAKAMTLPGPPP